MIEASKNGRGEATLTCGMVGGGEGAFIGDVHRKSLAFDGRAHLVAGCFSRDYANTLATGKSLGIVPERLYRSYTEMARKEANRIDKIDFVSIVTPNNTHHQVARSFLEQGISVVIDKPLVTSSHEAEDLRQLASEKDLLFCVTYTYTAYPMMKQARAMIRNGDIGDIRFVAAEYPQEWLATPVEKHGSKQATWRTDPKQAGIANSVGDIGSHVENIVSYVTGLRITSLCARLDTFVEGRALDDNASILVNYAGGAKGVYWVSQIAIGHDNDLKIRVFGTKGSIEWSQENPNYLRVATLDAPQGFLSRGRDPLYPAAKRASRLPGGHPEGYYEAFATLYRSFADALLKKKSGKALTDDDLDFPGVAEGAQGVKFIEKCVESSRHGGVWVDL